MKKFLKKIEGKLKPQIANKYTGKVVISFQDGEPKTIEFQKKENF